MARHKVAKCRLGYCIRCFHADSSLDCYVGPRILHDRPRVGKSGGPRGGEKAKDVGGMAASNYYRERGSSSNEGGPAAWSRSSTCVSSRDCTSCCCLVISRPPFSVYRHWEPHPPPTPPRSFIVLPSSILDSQNPSLTISDFATIALCNRFSSFPSYFIRKNRFFNYTVCITMILMNI